MMSTVVGASTPAGQKRPSPVAAQIAVSAPTGAHVVELGVGLSGAHALDALMAGAVLGDPLAREVPRLDLGEDLAHGCAGLLGDHALAARVVAVLGGVGDRAAHAGESL